MQAARTSGLLTANFYHATLAASLITILINAALVRSVPNWLALPRPAGSGLRLIDSMRSRVKRERAFDLSSCL